MRSKSLAVAALLLTAVFSSAALAQGTKVVANHKDWTLYSHQGEPADICFITSQPRETKPVDVKRKRAYFYVSSWTDDGIKSQISVLLGYELTDQSEVEVEIGNSRFTLFAKDDKAFVGSQTDELRLIDAMKRGNIMTVKASMKDGTSTEDKYSLIGVTAAINSLQNGCQ